LDVVCRCQHNYAWRLCVHSLIGITLSQEQSVQLHCPICRGTLVKKATSFTSYCKSCDYWHGNLTVAIDSAYDESADAIDDQGYISALDELRAKNFQIILDELARQTDGIKLSILDVGCASGSFMSLATSQGHIVTGVEPNKTLCAFARKRGLNVVGDYFPPAEPFLSKFDVIIFNDVFEHIPDINLILESCKANLKDDGLLILNLPNSDGLIFRIARVLNVFNVLGPWNRLWQVMFKTPHLHYFNHRSLNKLSQKHGFKPVTGKIEIPTIEVGGFWSRLQLDRSVTGLIKNIIFYMGVLALYPLIKLSEKDTFFVIYRGNDVR
jgi:SAM-dependent methyltransferase